VTAVDDRVDAITKQSMGAARSAILSSSDAIAGRIALVFLLFPLTPRRKGCYVSRNTGWSALVRGEKVACVAFDPRVAADEAVGAFGS
jgi:hypothetical protein